MAMRLPGGVRTTEDFWQFLINKRDGHCEVPKTRYGIEGFYNAHDERYTHTRHGYFLPEDPAYFDAPFFSVTEQDASTMDPQQRLLLEVVWECLENAGETNWEGKNIGCYVGVFGEDWLGLSHGDPLSIDRSHAISTGSYALANTVSYKFDFRGPSMTIQTGCSSSMVGIHEACQSLATGACSSAIVAGTNLILSPSMTTSMSGNMVLSTSGVCRTFDAEADGYGRGEAINALYLKPLGDAIKANDAIRAIIRSTAANSDGGTSSIAVPSIIAQEHLILDAYRRGNINDLSETAFVECHGTGTRAGDQVETTAVANVFEGKEIVIGAVKPNFGHSEGASGITSVIKAVLSLEHGIIPPNAHFEKPNQEISFKDSGLIVPVEPMNWPAGRRRRVSVNAFGIGGTDAHVILDSAHDVCAKDPAQGCIGPENDVKLLVISAQDAKSLKARIDQVTDYANRHPERNQDLSFTLGVRRKHLAHRAFAVYDPTSPLSPSDFQSAHPHVPAQLTFVFTGQGAQWPGMGQGLIKAYQCFKMDILELENVLRSIEDPPQWSLMEELSCATASRINEAEFCQPLCTAVQIGVVNLLAAWGIRPASVVGHSSGEIAAAYAAGAISARSAIILAYYRGKLAQAQKGTGGMASIGLGSDEVSPYLVDGVVIACKNSPQSVTISGEQGQIDQMVRNIQNDLPDTFCRKLQLDMAYHSHYMAAVGPIYEKSISNHLQLHQQMLPMFSSVDVEMITDPQTLNAAYWRRNLESTVLFSDAISSLFAERHKKHILVEIGPHCALSAPIQQIIRANDLKICPAYIPTLIRNDANCQHQLLTSVDLLAVNGTGHVLTDILPYPWQHGTRYWKESRMVREWRLNEVPPHELLGSRSTESTSLEPAWRQFISLENIPWLSDHIIEGKVVFPAAAYIAMVGEAILQLSPGVVGYTVRNAIFKAPLVIEESENVEVITTLRPARLNDLADSEWFSFTIASYDGTNWIKNCSGQVRAGACGNISPVSVKPYARRVSSSKWYDTLASLGLSYGAQFRGLQDISVDPKGSRAVAKVNNKAGSPACRYSLHPTMIDQCLQVMSVAGAAGLPRRITTGAIPASIDQMFIEEGENHMEATVDTVQESGSSLVGDATAMLGDKVVLKMKRGLCFALGNKNDSISPQTPLVARIQWKPDPDLCKPEDLLPRAATSLGRLDQMKKLGQVSLLYILETAERIKPLVPQSTHASKWKSWILYEDAAVRNGEHTLLPESKAWATQSSEERQALIKKLSTTQADQPGEHNIIITCTEVIYENCLEIMANKISTLDLLMEENRLGRIYQFDQENSDWSIFITYLSHSNPWLRILEIGAGTGSATAEALRSLCVSGMPMYSKYTFTDISPGFMTAAQDKFRENVNMEYKVLDISSDPLKQSFVGQSFDLIIASNVLHATPVLKQALKNVKRLLTPHGWLILHELAPGEDDGRINRPYISPEDWDKKLQYAGFTGTEAIRYDFDTYHLCVDMITRPAPVETATQPIVLLTDGSPDLWAGKVFSELEKQNFIVEWGKLEEAPSGHACVVFLLEHRDPFLAKLSEQRYHCLQKYLMGVDQSKLLWVTKTTQFDCKDPDCGLVLGFARSLRQEMMLDFYTLEIDVFDTESAKAVGPIVRKILKPTNRDNQDPNYDQCYWGAAANILRPSQPDTGKKLSMSIPGLLDTLEWLDSSYGSLGQDDVEVDIEYIGLNFRDIMIAMGFVGDIGELGLEGSGIVRRVGSNVTNIMPGDEILILDSGLMRTRIIVNQQHCLKLPKGLSTVDAVNMASVFATAIYSLINVGQLKKSETILIHSACGGVGQAAVQICQLLGVEKIYVTVGNQAKRDHLINTYGIQPDHIFDSRSASFLPCVMKATKGCGVDVVLNSLYGELLHASWECVAKFGRMIELGKRDFLANGTLSLKPFIKNRAFFGVDLLDLSEDLLFQFMLWHDQGKIKPIRPTTVFAAGEAIEAFRLMQQGTHIGKILIRMPDDASQLSQRPSEVEVLFSSTASYLLVGGLGGLGRAVSRWMVEQGARYLVYLSRTAGSTEEHSEFIQELNAMGCHVECIQGSVTRTEDVQAAISRCKSPLKGVFQMSMSLNDRPFPHMSYEEWSSSLSPKVQGTWNLHNSVLQEDLDFFVLFSSAVGICGHGSQANYAAANTFLDGFTQYRRRLGLPSSAIALGAVGETGLVAREAKVMQAMQSIGIWLLNEDEVLEGLKKCIGESNTVDCTESAARLSAPLIIGLGNTKSLSNPDIQTLWRRDARFASYANLDSIHVKQKSGFSVNKLRELIIKAELDPLILLQKETETTITQELNQLIAKSLPGAQDMDDEAKTSLAIDSLMAIEVRNWIRRNLQIEISLPEISRARTAGGLIDMTLTRLKMRYQVSDTEGTQNAVAETSFDLDTSR
ncbi:putative polyketide synthase [Aspergillus pseudonomiae]|uniref:Putative polyketide synthase n=1 Tax=Aspergillus pseudonomiae TaxID=1506151 RepID=A0A5N7D6B5_9EURO|nr:putative polyketide synthase [Aspergillus pseudonomiae]KAE8401952.1 putative polyketide synthase [Aspergillus pseudonomiae]